MLEEGQESCSQAMCMLCMALCYICWIHLSLVMLPYTTGFFRFVRKKLKTRTSRMRKRKEPKKCWNAFKMGKEAGNFAEFFMRRFIISIVMAFQSRILSILLLQLFFLLLFRAFPFLWHLLGSCSFCVERNINRVLTFAGCCVVSIDDRKRLSNRSLSVHQISTGSTFAPKYLSVQWSTYTRTHTYRQFTN